VLVELARGRRVVSRCSFGVRARRAYVCQLSLPRGVGRLTVRASLRRAGRRTLRRTVAVRARPAATAAAAPAHGGHVH
jgi:hypothetical protein